MANMNEFAALITLREGKKNSVNVADVKEILKLVRKQLNKVGVDIYRIVEYVPLEVFTRTCAAKGKSCKNSTI